MTLYKTLSQNFDIGDFIAPDILSVVDARTRAVAAGILERGGLTGDITRIIDLRADAPVISDLTLSGSVPSMNPDEFMPYDRPEAPLMPGFDVFEPVSAVIAKSEAEGPVMAEFDSVELNVAIPDLGKIEQTADLIQDDIALEMPGVSRFNLNLFKVKLDTLRFNREFIRKIRLVILIVIIAILNVILITYMFS